MKKVACMVAALIVLIGAVPVGAESFTDSMKEVNDSANRWYGMCIEKLLNDFDNGNKSATVASSLHYYFQMYLESERLKTLLIELPYSGYTEFGVVTKREQKTALFITDVLDEKFSDYLDEKMTEEEYIEYIRKVYESGKTAREEAEREIEDIEKK